MSGDLLPAEVTVLLAGILAESAFQRWAGTRIARLGDRTPGEAIADGDVAAVLQLVRSYRDPSFS